MPNLGTTIQTIVRTLHLDSTTVGALALSDIKRELIESMEYYATEAPWFMIQNLRIAMESDVSVYEVGDIEGISNGVRYITDVSVTPEVRYPVKIVTFNDLRNYTDNSDDLGSGGEIISTPYPRYVALEPGTTKIHIAPPPSTSTAALEMKVTRKTQIPIYEYSGGSWLFKDPEGVQTLGDSFENIWLREAHRLIEYRTMAQLLLGVYGGSDASERKAANYAQLANGELNRLRVRSNRKAKATYVPKAM